jgi:hypothetical protein
MPAESLEYRRRALAVPLQTVLNAPLPIQTVGLEFAASVNGLSPVKLSAQSYSTSALLRFL